ncbi:hypothetical protein GGR43_003707 [Sphingobium jiangsuense]|uniref:Uncharacterized protein n=1 Tax=Sphingobium jiangsuense TaxID=870476 RepID=A0A7W6BSI1_9SPHN|nr:hypothetical protein [Sphingobium jiangsuense]
MSDATPLRHLDESENAFVLLSGSDCGRSPFLASAKFASRKNGKAVVARQIIKAL